MIQTSVQAELTRINELLQDPSFAYEMAFHQYEAYHKGLNKEVPAFILPGEEHLVINKNYSEQKIASHIVGFYAVECVVGYLSERHQVSPLEVTETLEKQQADPEWQVLLDRFVNATWKAGQPFRGLNRISREKFKGADALTAEEISPVREVITGAISKLYQDLQPHSHQTTEEQWQFIQTLLHSRGYTEEMARHLYNANTAVKERLGPDFIQKGREGSVVAITVRDEKIATNLAGFYALESGLNYLVTKTNRQPSEILGMIVKQQMHIADMNLFARFANATWKAGQPFRGLDRIERETFRPFYFLSEEDIEKDKVQIRAAAGFLLTKL